jgi:hypothetical protein
MNDIHAFFPYLSSSVIFLKGYKHNSFHESFVLLGISFCVIFFLIGEFMVHMLTKTSLLFQTLHYIN